MENIVFTNIPVDVLVEKITTVLEDKFNSHSAKAVNITENNTLLTRQDVAQLLRISLPTLNTYTKDGKLKAYRIGGRVLYKKAEVESMLKEVTSTKYKRKDLYL
ncbi:helix-turn-helix domain-containing protein [Myroides sp. C15-4]|uniref:helix-turn-helix domain-containing protein n=1 Tax=Myroides sp. C15-4 TaxID=3400532 RepID=UPI003D2F7792